MISTGLHGGNRLHWDPVTKLRIKPNTSTCHTKSKAQQMGGLKYDRDWGNLAAAHNTPARNLEEKRFQFTLDRNLWSQRMNNSKVLPRSSKKPTFYYYFTLLENGISPSMLIPTYTTKILSKVQKFFSKSKNPKLRIFEHHWFLTYPHITEPNKSVANTLQQHTVSL